MAGKRFGAIGTAAVVAAVLITAFAAPAAYADDTTVDPGAPVATESQSLVVDTPSTAEPAAPAVDETSTADSNAGDASSTDKPAADQPSPSSNPEPGTDGSAPDPQANTVTPAAPAPTVEQSPEGPSTSETPEFVPTASIATIKANGYGSPGSRQILTTGTVTTNITADNPDYGVAIQVTTCLGGPSAFVPIDGQNAYSVNSPMRDYQDGSCLVTAQAFINGSPAGEPMSTTVIFSTKHPSAQVDSISATPVDASGVRSINVSGKVSLTDVDDPNTVLVVISYDGKTSAPLVIDADGNYSTVLTGEFPDGVYTLSAQAYLQQSHEMVPSGTPKSTQVEFKTVPKPKVATASVSAGTGATCTANSTVIFTNENSEWTDNGPDLSPGTHVRVAVANEDAVFADGEHMQTVQYTIMAKIAEQSTNPEGACYKAPTPPVVTPPTEEPKPETPQPVEVVASEKSDDDTTKLAETGQDGSASLGTGIGGALVALVGVGLVLLRRRRSA